MSRTTRRHVARGLVGLLVGFLSALVTITSMDRFGDTPDLTHSAPVDARTINDFCALTEGMVAVLTAADPHGWQCVGAPNAAWRDVAVDFQTLCQWRHGARARAVLLDATTSVGWACLGR